MGNLHVATDFSNIVYSFIASTLVKIVGSIRDVCRPLLNHARSDMTAHCVVGAGMAKIDQNAGDNQFSINNMFCENNIVYSYSHRAQIKIL